jgi:hypothetical protein
MIRTRLILITATLITVCAISAQTVVSGVVKDRETGMVLSHVSITAAGSNEHTITNDDGHFLLKTKERPQYIQLSHIGYKTRRQQLGDGKTEHLQIYMMGIDVLLDEVVVSVSSKNPVDIVRAAMRRVAQNYPGESELMRCFYRETTRKGSRFISVAEAVMDMYKTSYAFGPDNDAVSILKGRRLMSMKSRDTLGVKIQGGPVVPLIADVAKNSDYMLNEDCFSHCDLFMDVPEKIDNRLHYVIVVEPKSVTPYPMLGGRLYIDKESLTISRAELQLDVRDWRQASEYMLVKKPVGLRFRPKELLMTIVYNTDVHGITRMCYLRNEMRFNCDWKRRLFASSYTTVSEMVVTDRIGHGSDVKRPRGRSSFGMKDRFYDKVEYFEDSNFWEDYNIIEPTESLEHAINRLKKKKK